MALCEPSFQYELCAPTQSSLFYLVKSFSLQSYYRYHVITINYLFHHNRMKSKHGKGNKWNEMK